MLIYSTAKIRNYYLMIKLTYTKSSYHRNITVKSKLLLINKLFIGIHEKKNDGNEFLFVQIGFTEGLFGG